MKWLFAILVALNIVVFGITMVVLLNDKQSDNATPAAAPPVSTPVHELSTPATALAPAASAASAASLDWLQTGSRAGASEPKIDENVIPNVPTPEQLAVKEKERVEREKKLQAEKLKKEREAQAKKNQVSAQDYVPAQQSSNQASCNRSASVTLPEDDYHRIKGLLGQWPHAASRTVERREGNAKKTVKYSVAVPIQVDAQAQLSELSAKGFSGTLSGGSIVVGSYNDRAAAQSTLGRVQAAGFSAQLREQSSGGSEALSVSKMRVVFGSVDEGGLQSIQKIVAPYGSLQRSNCR